MAAIKAQLTYGIPIAGWLPCLLRIGDFKLETTLSNIPSDPMAAMLNTLIQLHKGINITDRIIWHEEPTCHYLQFSKVELGYSLQISKSDKYDGPASLVYEFTGTYNQLILPFYRALKAFNTLDLSQTGWLELKKGRVAELTQWVKEMKNS